MPFPSHGCQTCRARRVKCDEARPICGRCFKSNRNCGGYDQLPGGLLFRSENVRAESLSRRARRGAVKHVEEQENELPQRSRSSQTPTSTSSSGQVIQQRTATPISPPVGIDLHTQALNHFMHCFFIRPGGLPDGMWTHLQSFYTHSRRAQSAADATLELAIGATSLAYFGRMRGALKATAAAKPKYGEALNSIKSMLDDGLVSGEDQVLLAVMLLSNYEYSIGDISPQSLFTEAFRHLDGATALMRLRKSQDTWDKRDRGLDKDIRRQLVRTAVYRANAIPKWLQEGADFGEEGPELLLDRCLVRAANLRSRGLDLYDVRKALSDAQAHKARELIEEALALDKALISLTSSLPETFSYERIQHSSPNAKGNDLSHDGLTHTYPSFWHAAMCNRSRGARLLANAKIRRLLCNTNTAAALPPNLDQKASLQQAQNNERQIVDEICASVPFHMGTCQASAHARKAFLLVWPLTIACAIQSIPSPQRLWIQDKLREISLITSNKSLDAITKMNLHNR